MRSTSWRAWAILTLLQEITTLPVQQALDRFLCSVLPYHRPHWSSQPLLPATFLPWEASVLGWEHPPCGLLCRCRWRRVGESRRWARRAPWRPGDDNADDNNDDDDDYDVNGDDDNESEDRMLSSTISKFKKSINLWTTSKPVLNLPSECKLGQSLKKFY